MRCVMLDEGVRIGEPTVVCLGFFDGVHLGHAALTARAAGIARAEGLALCVHTFDVMPVRVLRPDIETLELTPLARKAELLAALGVDILAVSRFDGGVARMRAADFFHTVLLDALGARHIVCGFHHRFGHRGEADVDALAAMCADAGVGLDVIAPVTVSSGELISSSAIREALRAGDTARAEAMLGRAWTEPEQA